MTLDRATIDRVTQMHDPLGILSIYLDASPDIEARTTRSLEGSLRQELQRIEEHVKEEGPRARWKALHDRMEQLVADLDRLVDIRRSGRGRALFAPISDGDAVEVTSAVPFPTRVALEDTALIRPLLEAATLDPPTGIVTVAKGGVRVLDRRGGEIEEVVERRFEQRAEDMGNETGSPRSDAGYSGSAGKSIPQADYYERSVAQEQANFIGSMAERVGALIAERGWTMVVIAGDDRLAHVVRDHLPPNLRPQVLHVDHGLDRQSPGELWSVIEPEVQAARRQADLDLLARARDAALTPNGRGALGLRATLAALDEGRVETLILERGREHSGVATPDGRLAPEGAVPLGASPAELAPEPDIVERMVERALATSAQVVFVEPALEPADSDGVSALLRW